MYYILAALNDIKKFYLWTVPFRLVTFSVFTIIALTGVAPMGFIGVGLWEGLGALVTGLALYLDGKKVPQLATVKNPVDKTSGKK